MLKKTINLLLTENQQKIIFRLWKISSHHIYIGVFASLCLMVSSGISIFFPISIGKVTNIFTDNEEFLKLVERLNSFFVFFLIYSIVSLLTRISTDIFTKSFIKELRETYFKSLMQKDIEFFDARNSSDLFGLLTGDIEQLRNTTLIEVIEFMKKILQTIGAFIGMFYVSFKLSCLLLILIPVIVIIFTLSNNQRRKEFHNIRSHHKSLHHIALEALENIRFEFQKELNALKGSMTIMTVAHRLSTIKNSDKIVVLNNGIIEEMGKHEELLALNGTYKKLMERQVDLNI